jgi:hypothetical protein
MGMGCGGGKRLSRLLGIGEQTGTTYASTAFCGIEVTANGASSQR